MALVIVRAPLRHTRQHRQDRLRAVERLDLALLVDAEHHARSGGGQIEAYDVADLVHEVRIAGELEGLRAVRLQPEGTPDAPDRRVRKAAFPGHRAQRPMGGVRRRRGERPLDNLGHPIVRERPRPSRPRLVRQAVDALPQKAATPLADRVLVHAEFPRHRLVGQAVAQRRIMRQRSDMERATRWRRTCRSRNDRSSSLRTRAAIGRPLPRAIAMTSIVTSRWPPYNATYFSAR